MNAWPAIIATIVRQPPGRMPMKIDITRETPDQHARVSFVMGDWPLMDMPISEAGIAALMDNLAAVTVEEAVEIAVRCNPAGSQPLGTPRPPGAQDRDPSPQPGEPAAPAILLPAPKPAPSWYNGPWV